MWMMACGCECWNAGMDVDVYMDDGMLVCMCMLMWMWMWVYMLVCGCKCGYVCGWGYECG